MPAPDLRQRQHYHHLAVLSLNSDELEELDDFLGSDAVPAGLWGVDVLHGFLTSVALSATEIERNLWLPLVWSTSPEETPTFEDSDQEERLTAYVLRMFDDIKGSLADPERGFSPLVAVCRSPSGQAYNDGTMWCNGFMLGLVLFESQWTSFLETQASGGLLLPIVLLGSDKVPQDWEGMCTTPEQRTRLTEWIPAVVEAIHVQRFILELVALKESRQTLAAAKDLCRCGSRKAFRACCGAPHRLH